jgi:hypothetical protein
VAATFGKSNSPSPNTPKITTNDIPQLGLDPPATYPGYYQWEEAVLPYVKNDQLFVCPSASAIRYVPDTTPNQVDTPSWPDPDYPFPRGGYAGNVAYWSTLCTTGIVANHPFGFRSLGAIADPAGTFMVWDSAESELPGKFDEGWQDGSDQPTTVNWSANPPNLAPTGQSSVVAIRKGPTSVMWTGI